MVERQITSIMKTYFYIFILLPISIFAQKDEIIKTEKQLYDFCYCDYSFERDTFQRMGRTGLHTEKINSTINSPYIKGDIVYKNKDVISIKILHTSSSLVKEEYTKLEADTFDYVLYDDSERHRKIASGLYYFDRNNIRIDSTVIIDFDQTDYHEIKSIFIYHLYQKTKHGYWIEHNHSIRESGFYQHGKRNRDWNFYYPDKLSSKKITYKNGVIINEEELNLIQKGNNLEELEKIITNHPWSLSYIGGGLSLQSNTSHLNIIFLFNEDYTYIKKLPHHIIEGKWKLSLENKTLTIDDEIYKIDWMTPDVIQFAN